MLAHLTLFSLALVVSADAAGSEAAKMPWKDVRPVTMVVLDGKTQKPIRKFSYTYRISTPAAKYDPQLAKPIEVQSDAGEFSLLAPDSCEIDVVVNGENILGGFGSWKSFDLKSDNKLRRIEVHVATGVAITGTVVDARTGKPIADALVSPIIFTPPLFRPDRERAVKTDAAGKYTIHGVEFDMGINAWHPDYLEFNYGGFEKTGKKISDNLYSAEIRLEAGERLVGVVKDTAGKRLAGVKVSDGAGKDVQTASDGTFVLGSPRKWGGNDTYSITFEKDGYLEYELHPKSAEPKGFSIVLQPVPSLTGQVLDPQGQPLKNYTVVAGVTLEPQSWCCNSKQVRDPAGRFSLPVRTDRDYGHTGKVWIGVKAAGFALWDMTIDMRDIARPITARLTPGVAIRGSIANSKGRTEKLVATLLPVCVHKDEMNNETSERQNLGRMEIAVDPRGEFHFDHAGPGKYLLGIAGPATTPISSSVFVANSDLNLGPFTLRGTGRVAGVVYQDTMICEGEKCRLDEKRGLWAFAEGSISFQDPAGNSNSNDLSSLSIPFKADEHGRFHVDGVPVGMVSVGIPHRITADIIGSYVRQASVLEGKTTDVRFFDTSGQWEVKCKFQIGDGSPAQFASGTGLGAKRKVDNVTRRGPGFEIILHPTDATPTSFEEGDWTELDANHQIILHDVHPGKYRIVINDWLMSRGLYGSFYEANVEAKEGKTTWNIPLGGGCITGATQWSEQNRIVIHVIAVGKRTGVIRDAYCDEKGNFCVRYLPADNFSLWARDVNAGWCAMPSIAVKDNIADIGSHKLAAGGTITGKVPLRLQGDASVAVLATDSHGITFEDSHGYTPIGDCFSISNLWPGVWKVTLNKGDQVLAKQTITLQATETVAAELVKGK